jgi:hypothetical protein
MILISANCFYLEIDRFEINKNYSAKERQLPTQCKTSIAHFHIAGPGVSSPIIASPKNRVGVIYSIFGRAVSYLISG